LPNSYGYHLCRGAVLYRAGEYRAAVAELNRAVALWGNGGRNFDWLFLAMAHQRLGETKEARKWLDKANASLASMKGWAWNVREELEQLRREANRVVLGKGEAQAGQGGR
jgi:tetratricopeptide (TPR) repeat protein